MQQKGQDLSNFSLGWVRLYRVLLMRKLTQVSSVWTECGFGIQDAVELERPKSSGVFGSDE